ncbi:MAG: hypothetical protein SFU86_02195 [Pirellulaceae bacterium]|nr:hypothetical protein [Pirellulaceae bacterium]
MPPEPADLWTFLPLGYMLSVALETPVLLVGLSRGHSLARRIFAGFWLTGCTYPIVVLVMPLLIWRPLGEAGYVPYVVIAEIFAPAAECLLFWLAFWRGNPAAGSRGELIRDMAAIIAANLVSFLGGLAIAPWLLELAG